MKSAYVKPIIVAETLSLSMPYAVNCTVDRFDMEELIGFGYFNQERGCESRIDNEEELLDVNKDLCYHSNVTTIFLS